MNKKPGCLIAVGVVALLGIIGIAASGGSDDDVSSKVSDSLQSSVGGDNKVDSKGEEENNNSKEENDKSSTSDKDNDEGSKDEEKAEYEITDTSFRIWTNSIGTNWEQAIIEITNTGTCDLYLSSGSYDVEDASGHLVESQSYVSAFPNVLKPGEKGYMYEETKFDGDDVNSEYTIIPHADVEKAKVDCIRYDVSDVTIKDTDYFGIKVTGRVENTTEEAKNYINIDIMLYDATGAPLGHVSTTVSEELKPGEKIGFEASAFSMPKDITADDVASYTVYAYPTQFQF